MNKSLHLLVVIFLLSIPAHLYALPSRELSTENNLLLLNGQWEMGENRQYTTSVQVPGIATDPAKMNEGKLWYKREVILPKGTWTSATLELKGARFSPEVYVNGVSVSAKNGGMASTFHLLKSKDVKPGRKIILEIALTSLKELSPEDASYIPEADQWRSNNSSCLWDDVVLHFHHQYIIKRVIPFPNVQTKNVTVNYTVESPDQTSVKPGQGELILSDQSGNTLLTQPLEYGEGLNSIRFSYDGILEEWAPDTPNMYQLSIVLPGKRKAQDVFSMPFGVKQFTVKDKQFLLNGKPSRLRGGTVVWHRWVRSPEGMVCGYDTAWFKKNIVMRLKEHGANYLRFHLGVPPQRLLDLCDRYGLLVQYEWSFFHGMPATAESCIEQLDEWLAASVKHPSIAIYHPYNETEGNQLEVIWSALNRILPQYPEFVLSERDVYHVHKYWWSLFENLGLYYDDYNQFDKAIMVDEFGGNYLDEYGEMGGYKTIPESYLRFLGRNHTASMRLKHLDLSNGKVAEYWRRIGAAGVSPFCIASSWEDGNTWFLGKLKDGCPKNVWNVLTSAWSPRSVSLELWDKHFQPGQSLQLPVYFFNDMGEDTELIATLTLSDKAGKIYTEKRIMSHVPAYSQNIQRVEITLPNEEKQLTVSVCLENRPEEVKYPVRSEWEIITFRATLPEGLEQVRIYIPDYETELIAFARQHDLVYTHHMDNQVEVILLSRRAWEKIAVKDRELLGLMQAGVEKGVSVVMLDVGEQGLGQGYPADKESLGPLQGVMHIKDPSTKLYGLFGGIILSFTEAAEPETHLFPDIKNDRLFQHLPVGYSGMWNGLRGSLMVPAHYMEASGLNERSFLEQWKSRGADENQIKSGSYYAYELQGFYVYSNRNKDVNVQQELREKVRFLVEDAPALAVSINPNSPIKITDLSREYESSKNGIAENLVILANAGKNLTRTPVFMIDFGSGKGKLLVSQLLTSGRLLKGFGEEGLYGIRQDETAAQTVLNMLQLVVFNSK